MIQFKFGTMTYSSYGFTDITHCDIYLNTLLLNETTLVLRMPGHESRKLKALRIS